MLRAVTSVRNQNVEIDIWVQLLANILQSGLHTADDRVVKFPKLQNFHAGTVSFARRAMESVTIFSNCEAKKLGAKFC